MGGENKSSIESPGLPASTNRPVPARSPHRTAVEPGKSDNLFTCTDLICVALMYVV